MIFLVTYSIIITLLFLLMTWAAYQWRIMFLTYKAMYKELSKLVNKKLPQLPKS